MQRLVVQLSDTHVRLPGELAYRRVDTSAFLARAVAAVNALPQPADAVVVTGDLTDSGRADE
jgi:3',5'-cyclic AMP phosphodiesterase CpdA